MKVGILNITGYGGIELARILNRHPEFKITSITGRSAAGEKLADIFPHLSELDLTIKDELDELYTDVNNDGNYNLGEPFVDENNNGVWNENYPPTLPDGFNGRHLLGTDNTGRDVFTRLIDGYKISITFAIIVTTLSYIIGVIIGAILGFYGGRMDLFGVRLMEVFSAMPFLFPNSSAIFKLLVK